MPTKQLTTRQLGGHAAKDKNRANDPDFYRKIGSMGGKAPHKIRGFQAMTLEQRQEAGRKGGSARRGRKYPKLPVDKFQQAELDKLDQALQQEAKQVQ